MLWPPGCVNLSTRSSHLNWCCVSSAKLLAILHLVSRFCCSVLSQLSRTQASDIVKLQAALDERTQGFAHLVHVLTESERDVAKLKVIQGNSTI